MLTDLSCKALIKSSKLQSKPLKRADANGLFLHAFPNGSAQWKHKYRFGGLQKEISYGPYQHISLQEAREKHSKSYKQIKEGIDPSKLRQKLAQQARTEASNTFGNIAIAWFEHNKENWCPRHARRLKNRLETNLSKPFGKMPVRDVSRKLLLKELRTIEERSRETAKRCAQYAVGIFRYALDEEYVDTNIALDIKSSLKPRKSGHYPAMHIDDLPDFLTKLSGPLGGNEAMRRDVLNLLMLTLVRSMELLSAEWKEFDFKESVWTIPAAKMKMKKPHVVPLSKQVKEILLRRKADQLYRSPRSPSRFVFPSETKPTVHVCHTTASTALLDLGYQGVHSSHGFRSLGMGIAKQVLGYRHDVPNRQLAHEPATEVDRAYDRADFMAERTEMMQRLSDYIDSKRCQSKAMATTSR